MTRSSFIIIIYCLVSFPSLLIPINCYEYDHLSLPNRQEYGLFIFGDSLFDAGNNNYINTTTDFQANFWPYGESFFDSPTGRFSDGRLIPDFIAEYANLPLIPTFLPSNKHRQFTYGVNFASGGAGALAATHQGYVIDLKTQLNYFKIVDKKLKQKLGIAGAKTLLSKSVYLFSVGGNDYFTLFTANSSKIQSKNEYVGMVIGNLTTSIKEIYKKGGRKFGFANLLPLGCIPGMKVLLPGNRGCCVEEAQELVRLHNKALSRLLQELETQLQGFRYANHDFYTSLSQRINNPSKYGFKDATACCGSGPYRGIYSCGGKRGIEEYELCENPDEYLFYDSDHSSEKAYKQIAELMWNGTPTETGPYNLRMLFDQI
ncbi:GDSL esterase/lipase [Melia azedarach]|uniref:GDSL esterase/lipase n=1 Tax=Melia azedarach TaxID=155640 RepID=A0ACC1Y1X9_MELAZ|nr:GDSL esterase/lipase [Melia azedarach]